MTKKYFPKEFKTIREMMELARDEAGSKTAYRYRGEDGEDISVSYQAFYDKTQKLGSALVAEGFGNTHIACIGKNSYPWIVAFLTTLMSDSVFVPIDKDLPIAEMTNLLNNSEAEVVFCDSTYEARFREHRDEFPGIKKFIVFQRIDDDGDFLSYRQFCSKGTRESREIYQRPHDDTKIMKLLVYTSGTTGVAKGVMLTEFNLCSMVYYGLQINQMFEVGLSVLPYHHTYEATCDILASIHYHSTVCINDSIKNVAKNLQYYKPEYILLVPAFAEAFYKNIMNGIQKQNAMDTFRKGVKLSKNLRAIGIDRRRIIFKSVLDFFGGNLKMLVCGGAPIRPEISEFFDTIGIVMCGGYGITECSPLVCLNKRGLKRFDTAGYRLGCIEWKIDDPNDEGIGEILVRGDIVMLGYYKMPEKTAEAIDSDHWFHTGDYGKLTEDDQLIITGRKKNIIVLNNGKNIYPEEIENYISQIPYISEVVVRGIKNEFGEETGLEAEIYCENAPKKEKINSDISQILRPLASYKRIQSIVLRDVPFDKTATNKIKR